jgi:ribosomal protein L21E
MNSIRENGRFFVGRAFLLLVVAILMILAGRTGCLAVSVVLQWDPNSEPAPAGYKVYYKAETSSLPFDGTGAVEGASPIDVHDQATATISGLDLTRSYYFAVTAYDISGVESAYSNIVAIHPLSVTLSGSGTGNVNSDAGLSCQTGTCTSQFIEGSTITLMATPSNSSNGLSYFSGWTGNCESTNGTSCTVSMSSGRQVTSVFDAYQPVHIRGGNYYSSLQSAYAASGSSGILEAQSVALTGDFTAASPSDVTLLGGYDATYSGNDGYTELQGVLTVVMGTLTVENLVIR